MNHLSRVLVLCALLFATSFASATQQVKEWNMLVFLNGNNNLDSFGAMNINQMEQVGSSDNVNILVQWASAKKSNVSRLLIQKDGDTNKVTSPVVQNMGEVDMGDWKELVKFVEWANQNYPAKKYFVVVWDHGGGWHLASIPGMKPMDISWDDNTGNNITTEQLGQAMAESAKILGHKVDVYSSDACLMGMVEVASEMSESVQYYLGSQDVEPGAGWPYANFLTKWEQNPTMTAAELVKVHAAEYLAAYNGGIYGNRRVTMSAYDLSKIGTYEESLKQLAQEITALDNATLAKVNRSAKNAKFFTYYDYRDVVDFLDLVGKNGITTPAMQTVRAAQNDFVIANSQNQDQKTWGVSIWLPSESSDYSGYIERYHGLKFNQRTQWADLVTKIQGK
ncbi:clostripain-related cysteine peptidase [Bdellovibrio sp. SKB1291214]|uniref:clostripain-related cysteine peptidase n=1 Tax=Bdellovibrio sp. SKB1291214 TaxID=1732569 RepID=UPI000B5195D1|nr:clostripain-related cysteine peptidase [Bdellovibrio sp. SKB1291214]UYL09027.1 clostripain-related cysteine peptidase [Bdellovibrio sp. SKB1291214]